MAGDDVAHFVRQHGGELRLVAGESDQAARDVKLAVRQREGVDRRRVENGDLVFEIGPLGRSDKPVDDLFDLGMDTGVLVSAAIGRQNARVLALCCGRLLAFGGGRQCQRYLLVVRCAAARGD
jgi:hypothetical protein